MLLSILITLIVILGTIVFYITYLGPRLNPLNKAEGFINQNMVNDAILEYKKLLENNPANFKVHFKLGELYFQQGMVDQGVVHFEEIIKIDKYSHEIEKAAIQRKVGKAYLSRDEIEKAFQVYYEISRVYPGDREALYHVGFISLGQEVFDVASRHFARLIKSGNDKSFEVFFGSGIAHYQDQKTNDAIDSFKEALALEAYSDIANLAMAFAQQRKRDFKTAINYAKMVADNSTDINALIISRRLLGLLYLQARKNDESVRVFEELLGFVKGNDLMDEFSVILYDIGFVCIKAERTEQAYEYWNQLYQYDRNYKLVQTLVTMLRKEMDLDSKQKLDPMQESVIDYVDEWQGQTFPENFIWDICGLKSSQKFDLKSIVVRARVSESREQKTTHTITDLTSDESERLEKFCEIDVENFRIIANRIIQKLGYDVDEILPSYRESDGVDFLAHPQADRKRNVLVWVRRWKGTSIGEIPLRNFAQAINDAKAQEGLFLSTSGLTSAAEGTIPKLNKVTVVYPEQVGDLLNGLI